MSNRIAIAIGLAVWALSLTYVSNDMGEALAAFFGSTLGVLIVMIGVGLEAKSKQDGQA